MHAYHAILMRELYNEELKREADQARLRRHALAQARRSGFQGRALSWLGRRMIDWGYSLQSRYEAPAPLLSGSSSRLASK
jgi:hypothetical protein